MKELTFELQLILMILNKGGYKYQHNPGEHMGTITMDYPTMTLRVTDDDYQKAWLVHAAMCVAGGGNIKKITTIKELITGERELPKD